MLAEQHDALLPDDVRDFLLLVQLQEILQGKVDAAVEFASTLGGQCAFKKWLWRLPIVVAANGTTKRRERLDVADFLGHPDGRVLVLPSPPVV